MILPKFLSFSIVSLLAFFLTFVVVYAHGGEVHSDLISKVIVCSSPVPDAEREICYVDLCDAEVGEVNDECFEDVVDVAGGSVGADFGISILNDLLQLDILETSRMDHYRYAQLIGESVFRNTEGEQFGDIFLSCSDDFHYGCYYGFFEEIMAQRGLTPLEAATTVCNSISDARLSDPHPQELCYHTMGHMFMKHSRYTLGDALSLCDSLPSGFQTPCWDGVFMEGVNEALIDGLPPEGYFAEHPLSPCNTVAESYQELCYRNHGRHLIEYFQGSADDALSACSDADRHRAVCEHSVTDASEGVGHHMHNDDDMLVSVEAEESVSWFQKILNFISSLFGGSVGITNKDTTGGEYNDEAYGFEDGVALNPGIIVYENGVYSPDIVQISVGQQVVWINEDEVFWPASDLHPTHRKYPGSNIAKCGTPERGSFFDACEAMGSGEVYSFIFSEPGRWEFHDHINPQAKGVVIVTE